MEAINVIEATMRATVARMPGEATSSQAVAAATASGAASGAAAPTDLAELAIARTSRSGRESERYDIWKVDMNDLDLGAKIGFGSQGSCHKGFWGGTRVAVKVTRCAGADMQGRGLHSFTFQLNLSRLRYSKTPLRA
jgi:hypothetical protein